MANNLKLSELKEILNNSNNEQELINQICSFFYEYSNVASVFVGYKAKNSANLIIKYGKSNIDNNLLNNKVEITTVEENSTEAIIYNNEKQDFKRWNNLVCDKDITEMIYLPLMDRNNLLGAILIYSNQKTGVENLEFFRFISTHMAINIFKMRYEQLLEQNNKKLNYYERKYNDSFKYSSFGKVIVSKNCNIINANPEFSNIFGYDESEISGKSLPTVLNVTNTKKNREILQKIISGEKSFHRMVRKYRHKTGKAVWTITGISPIRDVDDVVEFFSIEIIDITDKIENENELKKYFKAIEHSPTGIVITDYDGKIEYVNKKITEITGYSYDEIIGENPRILNSNYHDESFFRNMWNTIRLGYDWRGEFRNIRKDGEYFWEDASISPVFSAEGQITHFVAIKEDVTEKKMILEKLKKMSRALEQSNTSVVITDKDGMIEYVNRKFWEDTGYTKKEVLNKNVSLMKSGYHTKEFYRNIWKTISRGENWIGEFQNIKKTGENYWSHAVISPVKNSQNEITHYVSVQEDITEKKSMENRLMQALDKFEMLYKSSLTLVSTLDLNGILERIIYFLQKIINFDSCSIQILKGEYFEIIYCKGLENSNEIIGRRFSAKSGTVQNLIQTKKESVVFDDVRKYSEFIDTTTEKKIRSWMLIPMIVNDKVIGELSVEKNHEVAYFNEEDSTICETFAAQLAIAVKNAEIFTNLKQLKDKAERANKSKSEFLANMSHEIRTPMNSVLGYAEILDSELKDENLKNYVNSIISSGNTLLKLINGILDLSKIEAGKVEFTYTYINLTEILYEIEKIFALTVKEKGIKFLIEIQDNFPELLYLDELRIKQVLINFISNSVKFTEKGYIKVLLGFKHQTSKSIDVIIKIEDSGIGIGEDAQKNIFDSFEREASADNKKYEGTGLGLTISRQIIKNMNGKIKLESEKNIGSTFTIELNEIIYNSDRNAGNLKIRMELASDIGYSLKNSKILVVDDNPTNLKLLKHILIKVDMDVIVASGGKEAVELFEIEHPDIVFMDINMPNVDGIEAMREIRKIEQGDIPIIAVTTDVLEDERKVVFDNEFQGYIIKPYGKKEILAELKRFLSNENFDNEKIEEDSIKDNEKIDKNDIEKFEKMWDNVRESGSFKEVEEFGKIIYNYGLERNKKEITNWSELLTKFTNSLDVKNMKKKLKEFTRFL